MAYGSADSGYGAGASVFHPDASHADTVSIADADLLFNGAFTRHGPDLILTGHDGDRHVVPGYFSGEHHPALVAPNGARLSADLVDLLAGSPAPGQYAQAASTTPASPIGKVEKIAGHVVVFRNGVEVALNVGDAVYKGDVIQTGVNSACGVDFPDGTALNLVANTRMALSEFSFDPNGHSNDALFSLVQGTFAFVAGKVAHTGDMKIETPVATMGIRGTTGFVQEQVATISANAGNVTYSFAVVEDYATNRVGSYELVDDNPSSPTYGQVIATVSQNGFLTFVTPQGSNLPPIVTTQPMTNSQLGFEQQIIDDLFAILNSSNANPQSTPGAPGSSTPPDDLPRFLQLLQNDFGNTYTFNVANGGYGQTPVTATINGGGTPPNNPGPGPQNTSNIFIWTAGNGTWTTPTWSQPGIPNTAADAVEILSGPLTYDANYIIGSLLVAPGVTLDVTGGTLGITNGITNYGTIVIGGDPPAVTASGIVDNFGCIIVLDCATLTLTNVLLANEGTIKAVEDGRIFANLATGSANYDLIEAAWGGKIVINAGGSTFDNSGQIVASHHGTVVLTDITVDSSGNWCCPAILVEGSGSQLLIGGTVTLEGCAPVVLSGNCAVISGAWGGGKLYNDTTISGYGEIGAGDCNFVLVNDGKIDANGHSGQTLVIDNDSPATGNFAPNEMINAGTIEATGCGGLIIENTTIDNSSFDLNTDTGTDGHIKVESGSKIGLDNATILQGFVTVACDAELTTAPGSSNEIETANGSHNTNVFTICNFGTIEISNASSLMLASSDAIDNAGTIELQACGDCCVDATTLYFDQGFAELKGGGQITLSDSSENFIAVTQIGDQVTNFDNTISGAGTIGGGGMLLVNNGTIDADYCNAALTLDPVSLVNTGKLEATDHATLVLSNTTVFNATYSFTTLNNPDLGGSATQFGNWTPEINGTGQVLGDFSDSSGNNATGFIYSGGNYTILQDSDAAQGGTSDGFAGTVAKGINDLGQVVGYYTTADSAIYGFLYSGGNYTTLSDPLAPQSTQPVGINDAGLIVGNVYVSTNNTEAFIYNGTDYVNLQDPNASTGNPANSGTYGLAINNSGEVVGNYYDANGTAHGFIYKNGNWTDVTDTSAAAGASAGTHAEAINNAGQVVGHYVDIAGLDHGFIYSNGNYTTLDDPSAAAGTFAEGINDAGQVVGYYVNASGADQAFIYDSGVYADLDVPSASGGSQALSINDAGQIVGTYYDANGPHGFVADLNGPYGIITAACGSTIDLESSAILYGNVNVAGTLDAKSGANLIVDSTVTNTGTIEATCGATLALNDTTVCNDGGTIEASGYGAAIDLFDATIVGGTLETRDCGIIQTPTGATFAGVTLAGGDFETNVGTSLNLECTTTIEGTVTFKGGGTFTLEGDGAEIVGDCCATSTLDNYSTILLANGTASVDIDYLNNESSHRGTGTIDVTGGSLTVSVNDQDVNDGTYEVSGAGSTFTLDADQGDQNNGTIQAQSGGTFTLDYTGNPGVNGSSGGNYATIEALAGGVVSIEGGIPNYATGIIEADGSGAVVKLSANANGAGVENLGTIEATARGRVNFQHPAGQSALTIYNLGGTIEAIGAGATVALHHVTVDNTDGGNDDGVIKATGTSTVELFNGTDIEGGTLSTSGNGLIEIVNRTGHTGANVTFDGAETDGGATALALTINGTVQVDEQTALTLLGTITNKGTIDVDGGVASADLIIDGTVKLNGGGTVTLAGSADEITGSNTGMLDDVNNTINGSGVIGDGIGDLKLKVEASAVVDADGTTLTIDTGNTNADIVAGTVEATNGGTLVVSDALTVTGTIDADGSGGPDAPSTVTLDGTVTLNTAGELEATNGGVADIQSGKIDNTVTGSNGIFIDGTSELLVDVSTLKLTGGGNVALASGSLIDGNGTTLSPDTLDNVNNTITGAGTIGDTSGDLALTNAGIIEATGTLTINTGDNAITNTGTLEATNGGILDIHSTVNDAGGLLQVGSNSAIEVADTITGGKATIDGGTLEFDASSNVNVTFIDGGTAAPYGELKLVSADNWSTMAFTGTISGFDGTGVGTSDTVDLVGFSGGEIFSDTHTGHGANEIFTLTLQDTNGQQISLVFKDPGGTLAVTDSGNDTIIYDPPATNASSPSASLGNDSFVFHTGANGDNTGASWDAGTNDHADWAHTHQEWSQLAGDMNGAVAAEIAQHAESHWHYALHGAEHLH